MSEVPRSRYSLLLLGFRVHVSHVPEENVLAAALVSTEVAEEHRRRAAHGGQVTLQTRLPGVALAALGAHEEGLARVLREEILGLRDHAVPYKN